MDKGLAISPTQSFFFQLHPSYFKVEHSFAKNIKNGSTYRLVIYKGIQKIDQMSEPVKARIVGGKIAFDSTFLQFSLSNFTPARNVEFTVKICETKLNEQQVQIAQYKIKSGDYIKAFKDEATSIFRVEAQLMNSFSLIFDLFLHKSKIDLERITSQERIHLKNQSKNRINFPQNSNKPGFASDNLSQSDSSQTNSKEGVYISAKKLSRRRGHEGKLKPSRQNSEIDSQKQSSIKSGSKKVFNFINSQGNEGFMKNNLNNFINHHTGFIQSPQKSQPSPTKSQNLVSVNRKDSNLSEIFDLPLHQLKTTRNQTYTQRKKPSGRDENKMEDDIMLSPPIFKKQQPQIKLFRQFPSRQSQIKELGETKVSIATQQNSNNPKNPKIKLIEIQNDKNELKLKQSIMRRSASQSSENNPEQSAKRQFEEAKDKIYYILFFVVSLFLFYNAMKPSRKI